MTKINRMDKVGFCCFVFATFGFYQKSQSAYVWMVCMYICMAGSAIIDAIHETKSD